MDPEEDGLIALMRENGIPITRSNYIEMMYAEGDRPDPWTPELEGELPTFLQLREDGSDPTAEPSSEGASRRPEMDKFTARVLGWVQVWAGVLMLAGLMMRALPHG